MNRYLSKIKKRKLISTSRIAKLLSVPKETVLNWEEGLVEIEERHLIYLSGLSGISYDDPKNNGPLKFGEKHANLIILLLSIFNVAVALFFKFGFWIHLDNFFFYILYIINDVFFVAAPFIGIYMAIRYRKYRIVWALLASIVVLAVMWPSYFEYLRGVRYFYGI